MTDLWPKGVRPISIDELEHLGIDDARQLFWDGRRIEIRRPLVLTGVQKAAAIAVTASPSSAASADPSPG